MKKKSTVSAKECASLILTCLSEGPRTTAELVDKDLGSLSVIGSLMTRLKRAGKVSQEKKGAPWRLVREGASPPRTEEEPDLEASAAPAPDGRKASVRALVLDALGGGSLDRADLLERIEPHLCGRSPANLDAALGG